MRIFSTKLPPAERKAYKALTAFFVALFFAMIWPIYPYFSRIEPRVLGIPFALVYLVLLLLLGFCVLLSLYLWEDRKGTLD